jgi:predicted nuclease of predicted toxin-antitoxin system
MLPELDWEIWLDCNLSPAIAKWMKEDTGWDVKSAYSLQLYHLADAEIYQKAKAAGKVILISKDADFPEFINRYGAPLTLSISGWETAITKYCGSSFVRV